MKTKDRDSILKGFIKLTRKLGKFPTSNEIVDFITSERQVRNHFQSFKGLKDTAIKENPELENIIIPVQLTTKDLQNYKLNLIKNKINSGNSKFTSQLLSLDYLEKFSEKVFITKITPYKLPKSIKKINRAVNITLSDLHFGADLKASETGYLNYGPKEEARRLAEVVLQVLQYKIQYREQTELNINLAGDFFQGKLHDDQDAAPIAEQVCRTIHLLSQALAHFGEGFAKINVYCTGGNHSRIMTRHKKRATSGKWDNYETIIYFALKNILSKYKHMKFYIPKTQYIIYESLGHKVFVTHGDGVLNIGNPGKNLNIAGVETQINKLNASMKDTEEIKIAIVGHSHCSTISNLNTGCILVTNGCLIPSDAFAVSLGYLENRSSQTLFETTKEHAVGDIRFIRVDYNTDINEELDKIIIPYKGLDDTLEDK